LVVSRTLLINIVIAVFQDAYSAVLAEEKRSPTQTTLERVLIEFRRRYDEGKLVSISAMGQEPTVEPELDKNNKLMYDPQKAARKRLGWLMEDNWKPYDVDEGGEETDPNAVVAVDPAAGTITGP
ncbi:hypothetical protein T484DRAFT_1774336, partial [Baffinella frigidus]